jgi:phosphoglycolate phosphatase-like HAD superfamily hydrolase
MIRAALIDLDGTLIDSNDAHAEAWTEAFRSEKIATTSLRVRRLVGMSAEQIIPILCGARAESELGKRISARHDHVFRRDYLPSLRPLPGARELLTRFKREGIRSAVISSGSAQLAQELLKRARVHELVDLIVTKESATPNNLTGGAGLIAEALTVLGTSKNESVLIGDSPYDIEAATQAGLKAIGLLCGGWAPEALSGIAAFYRDPADLVQRFELSLFARHKHGVYEIPFPL